MKYSLILLPMAALTLAACGDTTVRETKETIIKQVPVETRKEVIVQPTVTREVIIQTPATPPQRSCTYASAGFYHGTLSCQDSRLLRCEDGGWVRFGGC